MSYLGQPLPQFHFNLQVMLAANAGDLLVTLLSYWINEIIFPYSEKKA